MNTQCESLVQACCGRSVASNRCVLVLLVGVPLAMLVLSVHLGSFSFAASGRAKIDVPVGKQVELPAPGYLRYALTAGGMEIIQVQKGTGNTVTVRGLRPGMTTLILYLRGGIRSEYDVNVRKAAAAATPRPTTSNDDRVAVIQQAIGRSGITVRIDGDTIVLEGTASSELERERAGRIAQQYSTRSVRNNIQVVQKETPVVAKESPVAAKAAKETLTSTPAAVPLRSMGADARSTLTIEVGLSQRISVRRNLMKVLVNDETICEPVIVSAREIVVNARKPGRTSLFVWEFRDAKDVLGDVTEYLVEVKALPTPAEEKPVTAPPTPAQEDPEAVRAQIEQNLKMAGVTVLVIRTQSGSLAAILTGEVTTPEQAAFASQIASLFVPQVVAGGLTIAPGPKGPALEGDDKKMTDRLRLLFPDNPTLMMMKVDDKVIITGIIRNREEAGILTEFARVHTQEPGKVVNMVKIAPTSEGKDAVVQQVVCEVKVVEINQSAQKELGITWGTAGTTGEGGEGTTIGVITEDNKGSVSFVERHPGPGGWIRPAPLGAHLRALILDGKARILSNPNITTLEGVQGNILVGGNIPIPAATITGGVAGIATANVTFRPYGIILSVLPYATADRQITMQLRVEVSSPEWTNPPVTIQGTRVPGFKMRQTDTTLMVNDGDTIVIGGLISNEVRKNITRIPFLSNIPVLGELFKSKSFLRGDTELVIFLTPKVVEIPTGLEGLMQAECSRSLKPLEAPTTGYSTSLGGGGTGGGGTGTGTSGSGTGP